MYVYIVVYVLKDALQEPDNSEDEMNDQNDDSTEEDEVINSDSDYVYVSDEDD